MIMSDYRRRRTGAVASVLDHLDVAGGELARLLGRKFEYGLRVAAIEYLGETGR